ncbi:MAG: hypothetical protein AAF456_15245 [Planctomycetota bacterium]
MSSATEQEALVEENKEQVANVKTWRAFYFPFFDDRGPNPACYLHTPAERTA